MALVNRRIVLAARPHGEPKPEHFRLEEGRTPAPKAGEVLLRTRWLSLDPYMRGRMSAAKSYAKPVEINDVMVGATVAEVAASHHPGFSVGDTVLLYVPPDRVEDEFWHAIPAPEEATDGATDSAADRAGRPQETIA